MVDNFTLTENEYKKLSIKFRAVASRLLNSQFQEANGNLERFLSFIESSPTISIFIEENNKTKYDMESIVRNRGYNDKFQLPINDSEEISFIYQLLKHVSDKKIDYYNISLGYNHGKKIQGSVDSFNNQVVRPLVNHIVTYLGEMAIDMGLDKKSGGTQFNIGDFRGQLNHAEGQATISANQIFTETQVADLKDVSQKYIKALAEDQLIPEEQKAEVAEFLEAAIDEAESDKPKKAIVKTTAEKLQAVQNVATTGSAVYTLGSQILTLLQGLMA
ncbi:hypothetical protein AB9M93_26170 [Peribacillus frigoritolerans]|uniref:hypothetical protein n=1 Tax=Peribacillus frigoritolerans TaxID=450367 RepID=UPI003516E76F